MKKLTPPRPKRTRPKLPLPRRMVKINVRLPRYLCECIDRVTLDTSLTPSQIIRDAIYKHELVKADLHRYYATHHDGDYIPLPNLRSFGSLDDPAAI